jgi:hypothetical protein
MASLVPCVRSRYSLVAFHVEVCGLDLLVSSTNACRIERDVSDVAFAEGKPHECRIK